MNKPVALLAVVVSIFIVCTTLRSQQRMDPVDWFDWDLICARLAAMAPLWPPGVACGYHPLTFGYLAGVGEALDDDPAGYYEVYEHGWPWTFGYRFAWHDSKPMPPVTHTFSAYDGAWLAADTATGSRLAPNR